MSFNEVKDNIKMKYIDEKYEQLMADLVKKAAVEMNQHVYDAIQVD
jgi:hypothetical protein